MKQQRVEKAQSICKKIISEYIINDAKELILPHGIVTVTNVEISNDLSYIDVFASCLLSPDTLTKSLAGYGHEIQRILGKKVAFVKVPKIRFRYDDTGKNASQIYNTIKGLDI